MTEQQAELLALRDELLAAGAAEGADFAVHGAGTGVGLGSELVVLRGDDDGWHVVYRDMGRDRELLRTPDFAEARARFVEEALETAGSHGRGPRNRRTAPSMSLAELREWRRQQEGG